MKRITEIACFTDRVDEMADFYQKFLGSEPVARSEGMAIFLVGETQLFIHRSYTPAEGELPPENHLAFSVKDVDLVCAQLASQGLSIELPAKEYYWGYSAYLRDPEGQLIELIQAE